MQKRVGFVGACVFGVLGWVGASAAYAGPVTFDFTGSQGGSQGEGSVGNTRTFSSGGVTLNVTAWSYTYDLAPGTDNALGKASLGRWNTGLGVCNITETPCSSPSHQVDNAGIDDWVLFLFSTAIDITTVTIDPYGSYDRDVSYYVGNVANPLDLTGVNYAGLAAKGFTSILSSTSTQSNDARDVAIGGGYVNALLLGGIQSGDANADYFKIRGLTGVTRVPEPGTLLLSLAGFGLAAAFRRRAAR